MQALKSGFPEAKVITRANWNLPLGLGIVSSCSGRPAQTRSPNPQRRGSLHQHPFLLVPLAGPPWGKCCYKNQCHTAQPTSLLGCPPGPQRPLASSVCCKDSVSCLSSFFSCSTPLRHLAVSSSSLRGQRMRYGSAHPSQPLHIETHLMHLPLQCWAPKAAVQDEAERRPQPSEAGVTRSRCTRIC